MSWSLLEAQPEHKSNYELDGNDSIKLQIVLAFFQASDLFVNSPLRRRREIEIKVSEEKKKGATGSTRAHHQGVKETRASREEIN